MQSITATEVKQRKEAGENLFLLDVREPAEHEAFDIGGTLLPLGHIISMQIEVLEDHRDQEIICYCRSGQRSMQAALMLGSMGFSNVKNLTGGMLGWQEQFGGQ
jgi:rhodanese-related sulfurtransferase